MASSSDYGSLPIGSIIPYSGETAPEGYSICDGKELNRETYKELFSIIGTTFGNGDGTSTFNLPDLKGRISVGLDSSDTDFDSLGKTGGSKYLQKHSHQQIAFDSWGSGVSATHLGTDALAGMTSSNQAYVGGRSTLEAGTGNSGNLQPYIVLNYIIKIYGEAMLTGDVIDSLEGDSSYNAPSIHAVNDKIKELEAYSSTAINDGSEITLNPNPNPNYNPIDIQIDGKSEQKTYAGKNLFDKDNEQWTSAYISSSSATKLNPSTYTRTLYIKCLPNTTYTIQKMVSITTSRFFIASSVDVPNIDVNIYNVLNAGDTSTSATYTTSNNAKYLLVTYMQTNATSTTVEEMIDSIQIKKGTEATEYEPYTGGQPSPNPDYPQEIKSVSGVENLLDESLLVDTSTKNGITFEKNDDNTFNLSGTVVGSTYNKTLLTLSEDLQPNENYYFYCSQPYNSVTFNICVRVYFSDNTFQNIIPDRDTKIQNKEITATYVVFYAGVGTTVDTANNVKLMLSKKASDYVPYGHWLKVKNTGKNLFDKDNVEKNYRLDSNGLPMANNGFSLSDYIEVKPNTIYMISRNIISGYYNNISEYNSDGTHLLRHYTNSTTFSITTQNTTKYLRISDATENLNIIQLEKDTEATSYEPYQEQSTLIDMNKPNLANINDIQIGKQWNNLTNVKRASILNIPVKPNTTYTLSGDISSNSHLTTLRCVQFATIDAETQLGILTGTFTTGSNVNYVSIEILADIAITNDILSNVSVNLYEGFGNKDYYELCSIDNTKDELNIDKDGNVSITQNIGEAVLDGSESWVMPNSTTLPNMFQISTNINLSKYGSDGSNAKSLSNYFINGNTQNVRTTDGFVLFIQSNVNYIRIVNTNISTVDLLKTWLSTHPVTVKYILDKPQTISLGKMAPLKLLEGTNNITTNDELQPNMEIEYYTDVMGNPGVIPDYDGLPVGSEIDFDGTEIPDGFVQVDDPNTYSSEEVVIGTWFGKKLYRKSFRFNELATGTNNVVHGIDNLNEIINAYGSCKRNDDKIQPVPRVDASELSWQIGITDVDTQSFQVYVGTRYNGTSKIKNGNVTLEYTKTTD